MAFKYKLKDTATLIGSGETGQIVGRAEFTDSKPQYRIRYAGGDGRLTEYWWDESAIASVIPAKAPAAPAEAPATAPAGLPGL